MRSKFNKKSLKPCRVKNKKKKRNRWINHSPLVLSNHILYFKLHINFLIFLIVIVLYLYHFLKNLKINTNYFNI
jgi:hypothetical protein